MATPSMLLRTGLDMPAVLATQGERQFTELVTRPARAECLAQQGVSKHERGGNYVF